MLEEDLCDDEHEEEEEEDVSVMDSLSVHPSSRLKSFLLLKEEDFEGLVMGLMPQHSNLILSDFSIYSILFSSVIWEQVEEASFLYESDKESSRSAVSLGLALKNMDWYGRCSLEEWDEGVTPFL